MATSGITKPGDIVVKSIECYNRLIIDRNCNLNVPEAFIENALTMGIGANVNMPATTIDFTNSTIDFTGASIVGLSGNITGNLSFQGNIIADGVIAQKFYGGTYYGAVEATTIKTDLLMVTSTIMGDLCGDVRTHTIEEKTMGGGITMVGDVSGDFFGTFTGDSTGTHTGAIVTTSITGPGDINVTGTLKADVMGTLMGDVYGNLFGNFCGNAVVHTLSPKPPSGSIMVNGDLVIAHGNIIQGNLCVETLFTSNIESKHALPITINPGIITPILYAGSLSITNLSVGIINATTGVFTTIKVDSIFDNSMNGIDVYSETRFHEPVCIYDLQLERLMGKSGNTIQVTSNIDMSGNTLIADTVCANVILTDRLDGKHGPISLGNIVADTICANVEVLTPVLNEKHLGEGITINGNVTVRAGDTLTATIISDLLTIDVLNANLVCANTVQVDTLEAKHGGIITITSNVEITQALDVDTTLTATDITTTTLEVLAAATFVSLQADSANITSLTTDTITPYNMQNVTVAGDLIVDGNIYANVACIPLILTDVITPKNSANVLINGHLDVNGNVTAEALWIGGNQVVYNQQAAVADAAAATAASLTDNTGATPDQIVADVSITVGNVTTYFPTGNGAVTVTSNAATDLDTAQSGLATLSVEVNSALTDVDSRLDTINDNFSDLTDEVNKLITDVADIRTQFNDLLTALRAHGLIAT